MFARCGYQECRDVVLRTPRSGELVGTLTLYHVVPREVTPFEREVMARAANLAAIAMERHRSESALEYQALYDPLTDLPNRILLARHLAQALDRLATPVSGTASRGVAVIFVDLDRFKVVNDSEGHAIGDLVLAQVAERFLGRLAPNETLGRFGGDEFMVVCDRVADEVEAAAAAERFADALREPVALPDGSELFVTASLGIAFTADATASAESLIRDADVAMYRAKDQGRNQWVLFETQLDHRALERLTFERALRNAVERDEFELYYQPVVRIADGAITKVEALLRWHRPDHGVVEPSAFVALAEETGLIIPIGWWVLSRAVAEAARWPTLPGGQPIEVAVNLSARQLAAPDLLDVVTDELRDSGLPPERLCLEVTESALVDDVDRAVAVLRGLKDLGVRIVIDDFGTGYATLDYVRHFSMADELKIDRAFVEGVDRHGSQEAAIVSAAAALAKSLGFAVVAEGVETLFQMEALRDLRCDYAQGYLFSRPLPLDEVVELILSRDA
jgi:diguanylate cyclase (GGDEF)-like protein